jgi:hypothetical protein
MFRSDLDSERRPHGGTRHDRRAFLEPNVARATVGKWAIAAAASATDPKYFFIATSWA